MARQTACIDTGGDPTMLIIVGAHYQEINRLLIEVEELRGKVAKASRIAEAMDQMIEQARKR